MYQSDKIKIALLVICSFVLLKGQMTFSPGQPDPQVSDGNAAYIKFDIQPANTTLSLDGVAVAHEDTVIRVVHGLHKLNLRCAGYNPMDFDISLTKGDTLKRKIFMLPFSGDLRLNVPPGDYSCDIYRNGRLLTSFQGNGGLNKAMIGEYVIRVSDGEHFLHDTVIVSRGKMLERVYTRQDLLKGYAKPQDPAAGNIRHKSLCIDISGGYSVYDVPQNNLLGRVRVSREIRSSSNTLNFGLGAEYYSPYIYRNSEEIFMDPSVDDDILAGGFLSWKGRLPSSFLGLGYEIFGGVRYSMDEMNYVPFYDIPLFYFCPSIVVGDSLTDLSLRPYVRYCGDECENRCEAVFSITLNEALSIYARGDCHIPAEYIPEDVRVFAGTRISILNTDKALNNPDIRGGFYVQPSVTHVVCNDGFWSQGTGMDLYTAYAFRGGIRCGVAAAVCTFCSNSDFKYLYRAAARLDFPVMINARNGLAPSLQCGMCNQDLTGEIYFGPFASGGLCYERYFGENCLITAGVSVPVKLSDLQDLSSLQIKTLMLSLGLGITT